MTVGDTYDDAMCDSFLVALERELLDRGAFKTQAEARTAVSSYRHSEGIRDFEHRLVVLPELSV